MKKLIILASAALLLCACSETRISTATYETLGVTPFVTPVQADLQVSPNKITHTFIVTKAVRRGGEVNAINSAVREALKAGAPGSDVLVGIQTTKTYSPTGKLQSIVVSGFPAKYVNFRNAELPKCCDKCCGHKCGPKKKPAPEAPFGKVFTK